MFTAALILIIALATIGGAWAYEAAGYAPCELCLKQRWAYYAGLAFTSLTMAAISRQMRHAAAAGYALLVLIFACNALLGVYHAGVEFHLWVGPSGCTGAFQASPSMQDFMKQLQTTRVVRCDETSLYVFGLSLAVWNIFISTGLGLIALLGWTKVIWPGAPARLQV